MLFFFFFSSRRRHTRYWRDWSSDVCSSDLKTLKRRDLAFDDLPFPKQPRTLPTVLSQDEVTRLIEAAPNRMHRMLLMRSEERRVGKSVDLGGRRISKNKKELRHAERDIARC